MEEIFRQICLVIIVHIAHVTAAVIYNCDTSLNVSFIPHNLPPIREQQTTDVSAFLPVTLPDWSEIIVMSSDERVAMVNQVNISSDSDGLLSYQYDVGEIQSDPYTGNICYLLNGIYTSNATTDIQIQIKANRLGKADLSFVIQLKNHTETNLHENGQSDNGVSVNRQRIELKKSYTVVVLRNVGIADQIFHIVIQVLLAVINFAFGCALDMSVILAYIKKPVAPSIGMSSQFLLMPLLGMAITQALDLAPEFGIGLIALACAPGGGASNSWTALLGGDINLSLTMTFLSLTVALGMMPLWMFIISRLYFDPSSVKVPYLNIFTTICIFVGPCFVGILLNKLQAKIAKPFIKLIKPLSIIFLLWVLTFGTYVNLYMWKLMGEIPLTIAAGILLPWCGFVFGFAIATVTRQGRKTAITIAIETGIQNMGIPIVLLQRSFPQPEGDLGATMVNSVAAFTPIPLFVAFIALTIKRKCCEDNKPKPQVTIEIADDTEEDLTAVTSSEMLTSPIMSSGMQTSQMTSLDMYDSPGISSVDQIDENCDKLSCDDQQGNAKPENKQ